MRQIETMTTEVIAVTPGANYTIGINSAAFIAAGTACTARRLPALPMFGPRRMLITNISAPGTAMVVTLTETNPYHVGGKVRLKVPEEFGMYQANDLIGTITAVGARSITLDIDTNGFTAFAFPLSAAVPFTHAQVIPVGEDATILTDSITNNAYRGLILGTGICGPAGATVYYSATRADGVKTTSP